MPSHTNTPPEHRSLDEQRAEFSRRRLIATPLAGTIAWAAIGIVGIFATPLQSAWAIFIATGCIAYLGIFLSKLTGENFLDKTRPKNTFDRLFFHTVFMALLVYAIAIPFFRVDYTSLPLTVGILTGLMWLPLSWTIQHWVGIFHAVSRTLGIVIAWYVFPQHRFVAIPVVIVAIYLVTIFILEKRWREVNAV